MDYLTFCRNYFEANRMPVTLLYQEKPVWSALAELLKIKLEPFFDLFPMDHNPSYCAMSPDISYGRVHVEGTQYDVIVGPAFSVPMTDELAASYLQEVMLPVSEKERVTEFLYSLQTVTPTKLGVHLSLIYQCLNGNTVSMANILEQSGPPVPVSHDQHQQERMARLNSGEIHNTYLFEIGLYECVKSGQTQRLKSYLELNAKHLYEGQMAALPLRQAKNVLIVSAAKNAMIGAIPGGLDVEKAYQLTEYYIRECEKLTTIEAVNNLQYAMVLDFCRRTGEAKIPEGISSDTFTCMNFIRTHVNEPIALRNVAGAVHRSESYVMKLFRTELGFHVGAYITRCKLEEARSMLIYTDKHLAEISAYLCFSSQSYFQNVFKKQYGMTPTKFRRFGRKL